MSIILPRQLPPPAPIVGFDWSGSFNGLSWGPDTPLRAVTYDGVFKPPPLRINDAPRLGSHGSFFGRDSYDTRIITITANMYSGADADFNQTFSDIEQAMVVLPDSVAPLILNGGQHLINVRPNDFDVPRPVGSSRLSQVTMQFRAADPMFYDANETVDPINMSVPLGGWVFPWVFPWTFTPPTTSSVGAFNAGNIDSFPWFRVPGPVDVGFELRNLTTQAVLQVGQAMLTTDWCDVDMGLETVMFQSVSSRRGAVIAGTDFWSLMPGLNTVRLSSLGATSPSIAFMHYRSAYIALHN